MLTPALFRRGHAFAAEFLAEDVGVGVLFEQEDLVVLVLIGDGVAVPGKREPALLAEISDDLVVLSNALVFEDCDPIGVRDISGAQDAAVYAHLPLTAPENPAFWQLFPLQLVPLLAKPFDFDVHPPEEKFSRGRGDPCPLKLEDFLALALHLDAHALDFSSELV